MTLTRVKAVVQTVKSGVQVSVSDGSSSFTFTTVTL